jgi:hypothetical protein
MERGCGSPAADVYAGEDGGKQTGSSELHSERLRDEVVASGTWLYDATV